MPGNDLIYQIALTMIPDVGPILAKKLIDYIGSPEAIFREKPYNIRKIPGIGNKLAQQITARNYLADAEKEIQRMQKHRISHVHYKDSSYPWRLKHCEDSPLLLYYRGNPSFGSKKMISIVGTRKATVYGRDLCRDIIKKLSENHPEMVVVSGLAYGIDIIAHRAALEFGIDTFAVLAHGLHTIYPSSHSQTARDIISQGALMSDFPTSMLAEKNNFLRRNRIIAGLSEATLVVESGDKGGALITADLAASYNREVFAIPGKVKDSFSKGCNTLIKNNVAGLVESAEDIEQMLDWKKERKAPPPKKTSTISLSTEEKKVLDTIEKEPEIGQEVLSGHTGIPLSKLMGIMLQLEMQDLINVLPGNRYCTKLTT